MRTSTPAPTNATIEGSMCSTEWPMNAVNTAASTIPHLTRSVGSRIASRSSSDMTSATRSASTLNDPRKSRGNKTTNTTMTMTTIGVMCTRKSLNVKPARLAMMMLGGSPTNVEAPPMLEANTSAIRKGAALIASRSHTSSVTGAINKTVVTLSSSADATAVTTTSKIMIRRGEPLARLADQIAMYSNTPVCRSTLTMIIMPNSKKTTSQSIPVSREKNTSSDPRTPTVTTIPA